MKNSYKRQVKLLLEILPHLLDKDTVALKGGTAINLFYRNMPRLSVDIDLVYLPIESRDASIENIDNLMTTLTGEINNKVEGANASFIRHSHKINIERDGDVIKIEPNTTLRGTIHPVSRKELCKATQSEFELSVFANVLSLPDLYGGKICAALDRQHPRDLFDIKNLFENEGLTDQIRKTFIIYLAQHNRPPEELLKPNRQDISHIFEKEFFGMTDGMVELEELCAIRERLISEILTKMTEEEKLFLISVVSGEPQWELIDTSHIEKLPGIQWKLKNVKKMDTNKKERAIEKLSFCLGL